MNLDDFKNTVNQEEGSLHKVQSELREFNRTLRRNFAIESLVAAFSFVAVMVTIFSGHLWFPYVASELLPDRSMVPEPRMNIAMYSALVLMGLYSVILPIKRSLADRNDVSLSWTVASRVASEIARMEKQKHLWSTAHLWSIGPAVIIGVLFFWGLNASLSGSWIPSFYLWIYFGFVVLSVIGGLWLKNDMIARNVDPLLQRLYGVQREIHGQSV